MSQIEADNKEKNNLNRHLVWIIYEHYPAFFNIYEAQVFKYFIKSSIEYFVSLRLQTSLIVELVLYSYET